jgi:hypothetical protein
MGKWKNPPKKSTIDDTIRNQKFHERCLTRRDDQKSILKFHERESFESGKATFIKLQIIARKPTSDFSLKPGGACREIGNV